MDTLDTRDKHLCRHMKQRMAIAASLPPEKRRAWARRCIATAAAQRRTVYFMMSRLWLSTMKL